MTANEPSKIIETLSQGLSKREQKKMRQAISIMERNMNPIEKQSKRSGHHLKKISQSVPRKILKTDAPSSQDRSEDASSSQPIEATSKVQKPVFSTLKLPKNTYNPKYEVPEEDGIFVYMMDYNYREKQKIMGMQDEDWRFLQTLGNQEIKKEQLEGTKKGIKKTMDKLNQQREKVDQLFSKGHRDFTKKYINETFLFS